MSPLRHCIVVVVLGGELDRDILQDIHVRDELVTEVLYRGKPSYPFAATTVQSPGDIVLHGEPINRLEAAPSIRAGPLARVAEELVLEIALTLALPEGYIPRDREGKPVIALAEASVGRIALPRMRERQALHDQERRLYLGRTDGITVVVAVAQSTADEEHGEDVLVLEVEASPRGEGAELPHLVAHQATVATHDIARIERAKRGLSARHRAVELDGEVRGDVVA